MRSQKAKTQSIKFMSQKNGKVVTVFASLQRGMHKSWRMIPMSKAMK